MIELYTKWVRQVSHHLPRGSASAEDDWEGYVKITKALGDKVQIVGDDLFVTNTKRLEKGIKPWAPATRSSSSSTRSAP